MNRRMRVDRARWVLPGAVILIASAVLSCPGPVDTTPEHPRLVLLYATCTLAKGFIAPYAPDVRYTPHLERFGESSLRFERHQTESGQSGIAFAALFSGTHAPQHGIYAHPSRMSPDVLLITEAFAAAGYDVLTWLNHPNATAR